MIGARNVKLHKRMDDGETIDFFGSLEEFEFKCPASLKAIAVDDICVIEFGSEISPDQIAANLTFIGNESADFNDEALDDYDVFDWGEYQILPGLIQRQVIVIEEGTQSVHQIVGIELSDNVELFARKPQYLSQFINESFSETNLLAYHSWYSEGPGPVSWDGESAVFLIRGFLIETSDGDLGQSTALSKAVSVAHVGKFMHAWLDERDLVTQFVLFNVTPIWGSDKLSRDFHEATKKLSHERTLSTNLSSEITEEILNCIRKFNPSSSRILSILEDVGDWRAENLIQLLARLANPSDEDEPILFEDLPDLITR